jgi:hypothetical protein
MTRRLPFTFVSFVFCFTGPLELLSAGQQAGNLRALHRAGQTILTWREVSPPVTEGSIAVVKLRAIRRDLDKKGSVRYRIYRSERPITTVEGLKPVGEVSPLTGWNADYYGVSQKPELVASRYVVEEGKGPVPPGTGIFAYNPATAGRAYYAVTRSVEGRENTSLNNTNRLQKPVEERVGRGVPILQRIEKPKTFQYVDNPTLYYYVRWESPPACSVAGKPFDYLVAVPANLAKPAPVGIHLHCWGGSLNGGYGWWYNAEKGHILISSNQIPYDWWKGGRFSGGIFFVGKALRINGLCERRN